MTKPIPNSVPFADIPIGGYCVYVFADLKHPEWRGSPLRKISDSQAEEVYGQSILMISPSMDVLPGLESIEAAWQGRLG